MEQKIEDEDTKKEEKDSFYKNKAQLNLEEYERRKEILYKTNSSIIFGFILTIVFILFYFIAQQNADAFKIEKETIIMLNNMINAFTLLIIPFIFGGIGAATKLSFNNLDILKHSKIIYASGFFAAFSWVGIKSEIALSILLPKADTSKVNFSSGEITQNEFYSMVFLAIIVGMFATNFYVFVNKKVENITDTSYKN